MHEPKPHAPLYSFRALRDAVIWKILKSHQPSGLGWSRVGCLFSTPLLSTLLVSTLWGGVYLYSLLINIPPNSKWINHPNRDPPSKCCAGYTLVSTMRAYTTTCRQNVDSRLGFSIKRRFPFASWRLLGWIQASWRLLGWILASWRLLG